MSATPVLKNQYFLEHLTMVISGNVTNYVYYTNMNNIYMVYWHIMVVPVKFSF